MKRLFRSVRQYSLLSLSIVTLAVSLALQQTDHQRIAHWLLGAVSIAVATGLLWGIWERLRTGKFGFDILTIISIVSAVLLKQYWTAIVIILLLAIRNILEKFADRRARQGFAILRQKIPANVSIIRKGKNLTLPLDQIQIGDKITIEAKQIVPVDAIIIEGETIFDQTIFDRALSAVDKQSDDYVVSGSVNLGKPVTVKVAALAIDSQQQRLVKQTKLVSADRARFVRLAERYTLPFTFTALAIASAAWIFSGESLRFLEVVVVASPVPLLLAPLALAGGLARSTRFGIFMKHSGALENLADTDTLAFATTGILTQGKISLSKITTYGSHTKDEILQLAASLNPSSRLAQTLVAAASAKNLKLTKIKHAKTVDAAVAAQVKGRTVMVGPLQILQDQSIELPAKFDTSAINQAAIVVVIDDSLAGVITFDDELQPHAQKAIKQLSKFGISEIALLTGDSKASAQALAKQLGIKRVDAELSPADILYTLEGMTKRPVSFVGDSLNDAPALHAASTGVALNALGSSSALETADVAVMSSDISRVAVAISLARQSFRIAQQSMWGGIVLSLVLMGVFATGKLDSLTGAIAQGVVVMLVIASALRASRIKA